MDELSDDVIAALDLLRNQGFAVTAFTPSELRGSDPGHVEDAMTERGWCAIETLATEPYEVDD